MTDNAKNLIDYIFSTEITKLDSELLSANKGLSALCLLYKTNQNIKILPKNIIANISLNNISTSSVPEFIAAISNYVDIKLKFDNSTNSDQIEQNDHDLTLSQNSLNKIYFGPPGTGKSHAIKEELKKLGAKGDNYSRVTFHPDYDYHSFVGGYKPFTDTEDDDKIKYKFVPQVFTDLYVKAWSNTSDNYYLVIEEIGQTHEI